MRSVGEPFLTEYEETLRRHSADYANIGRHDDARLRIRASPEIVDVRDADFENRQLLDWEGVLGRAWSSSYVVHGVKNRGAFDGELARAFERHQKNGVVEFVYKTEAIAWRL